MANYELRIAQSMTEVPREDWDGIVSGAASPLLSWGLLALLEESGSICPETGWTPAHFLLRENSGGRLVAAAPFYGRGDSWGEFVYDMEFARAAQRAGLRWYPKLVGMVPATPAPAWRVLVAPDMDEEYLTGIVLDAASEAARRSGMGGVHVLWPAPEAAALIRKRKETIDNSSSRPSPRAGKGKEASPRAAWAEWSHQAFLWTDEGFGDFSGWLGSFSKNMRRNVLRERAALREAGVESRVIRAEEAAATPGLLGLMAELYESHNDKFGPWAAKFLTQDFFLRLPEFLPSGWALSTGLRGGEPIALAFLFEGGDRIYGRYYGALEEVPNLHFELCYYRPVEYALERGIASFDPGMGSPHKARRGFRSGLAPSFHRLFDPRLADFVASVLPEFNEAEAAEVAALNGELPYKAVGQARSRTL